MQKHKTVMTVLVSILLLCTGCSSSQSVSSAHADASSVDEFTQKYILTRFYGSDADRKEWIRRKENDDIQHDISFDKSTGYLTITASLTQAQYWVRESENEIEQNSLTTTKDDNYSISVNATDTEMTIASTAKWNLKHLQNTVNKDLMAMEVHQVFSGISSWHIDADIINEDTGEKVKSFSLPDEDLILDDSIWQS